VVIQTRGLIERSGSGVGPMTAACRETGAALWRLEQIVMRVRVTMFVERVRPAAVEETDQAVLDVFGGRQSLMTSEIDNLLIGLIARGTRTRLARCVVTGLPREVGTKSDDRRRRY